MALTLYTLTAQMNGYLPTKQFYDNQQNASGSSVYAFNISSSEMAVTKPTHNTNEEKEQKTGRSKTAFCFRIIGMKIHVAYRCNDIDSMCASSNKLKIMCNFGNWLKCSYSLFTLTLNSGANIYLSCTRFHVTHQQQHHEILSARKTYIKIKTENTMNSS